MRTRIALSALAALMMAVVAVGSNATSAAAEPSAARVQMLFEVTPCC
jgi:hypothetical protein